MLRSRFTARSGASLVAATAILALTAGVALAHPESEGDHPSGCVVTAEPGTVAAGGTFTVAGNFGGASIFVLPGADASPPRTRRRTGPSPKARIRSVSCSRPSAPATSRWWP